jgi:hypothetical protein
MRIRLQAGKWWSEQAAVATISVEGSRHPTSEHERRSKSHQLRPLLIFAFLPPAIPLPLQTNQGRSISSISLSLFLSLSLSLFMGKKVEEEKEEKRRIKWRVTSWK